MKTKTIWMLAIIFGILATGSLYLMIQHGEIPATQPAAAQPEKAPTAEKTVNPPILEIPPQKRAISIPINEVQGVSGNIRKGDFVDVIIVSPDEWSSHSGQLLLQKVKVLSLGKSVGDTEPAEPSVDYRMATLEVTPSDGVSLALAAQKKVGIYLMLRAPGDASTVGPVNLPLEKLLPGGMAK